METKPDAPQQAYSCIQCRVEFLLEKITRRNEKNIFSDSQCPFFHSTTVQVSNFRDFFIKSTYNCLEDTNSLNTKC